MSGILRRLAGSRLFWGVLVLKLVLGTFVGSHYLRELFAPFLSYTAESWFADPWAWFAERGHAAQFPYPPVMLYVMVLPRLLLGPLLDPGVWTVTPLHLLVTRLPLLASDLALTLVLAAWFPHRFRAILVGLWASPLLIYVTYWHGQLDLVPTALLFVGLHFLRRERFVPAAVLFGLMLATKSHLFLAVPFLVIYAWRRYGRARALGLAAGLAAVYVAALMPYATRAGFRAMVFGSEEQLRVFSFALPLDASQLVYLAPFALAVLGLRFLSYARINWDLLMVFLGLGFSVFLTLAPPQPGYVLWSLPFLVLFYASGQGRRRVVLHVYTVAYFGYFLLRPDSDAFEALALVAPSVAALGSPASWLAGVLPASLPGVLCNLSFAVLLAAMGLMVLEMYQVGVRSNDAYRERVRPVLVGVAGDSGAGKDTLAHDLVALTGRANSLVVSGDDYHRWPRGHEAWQVYTHLDVRANDLHLQAEHAVGISRGASIVKGTYDHASGAFTPESVVDPRQVIVFSGLHTLLHEAQRRLFDLTVFLDPDEALRRHWKVARDVAERGHSAEQVDQSLRDREADRAKSILPQRDVADLVFRARPEGALPPDGAAGPEPELALDVLALNSFRLQPLVEALGKVPGLEVEHAPFADARLQRLAIRGRVDAEALRQVALAVVSGLHELAPAPEFTAGVRGLQQVVLLVCLSERLRWSAVEGQGPGALALPSA